MQLWRDTGGGCDALAGPVALTNNSADCVTGFLGRLVANSTPVDPSSTYYLAVAATSSEGGEFELALAILQTGFDCVVDQEIRLVSRSSGEPLDAPLHPGETVGICMNINEFSSVGNNCQWFQGIVPVFGNGWDPALSFEGGWGTPPVQATLNGDTLPANGQSGSPTGIWDWVPDATYHFPHCFYRVGWTGDTANYTMCNVLFDSQCSGTSFQGGSDGPCWGGIPGDGDVLPPGWFHYNIQGACPEIGHPNVDWGDGACCSCSMGPWQFCFELTVRSVPVCATDSTSDLSVGFFTFADGETGTWTAGPSICGQGEPAYARFALCCAVAPDALFSAEVQELVLTTENLSTGGGSYLWQFGDGDTSTAISPMHTYDGPGQYTVTLIVTNQCGTDTSSVLIDVSTTRSNDPARDVLDLRIHPNPNNGQVHLQFGDVTGSADLRVCDIYGRIVYFTRNVLINNGAIREVAIGSVPGVYYLEVRK
ncbi:MAG: PKD domain-containing protein, partial [Saprospiraceae bacterium]|nr:PKD domain-containing protein [Saprospiraceae bacterium]